MLVFCYLLFFFFKQKTAYEMRISELSSDVCSSDLEKAKPKPSPPKKAEPEKVKEKPKTEKRPRGSRLGSDFLKGIETERPTKSTSTTPPAEKMSSTQVASLNAEIYRQLKPHWKPPSGADAELLKTQLSVHLNRDGSLQGRPEVLDTTGVTASNKAQVRSEEHTSELQSLMRISYAVFCLKKKTTQDTQQRPKTVRNNSSIKEIEK